MGGISAGRRWIWELDRAANWSNLLAGKKKKKVFWSEWAKIREGKCREKSRYVQYCETRDETKQSPLEFPSRHSMSGPLTRNRLLLLCCIVPLFETMPQHSRRSSDTPETRIRQPKKKQKICVFPPSAAFQQWALKELEAERERTKIPCAFVYLCNCFTRGRRGNTPTEYVSLD